jgi:hypothetical protein
MSAVVFVRTKFSPFPDRTRSAPNTVKMVLDEIRTRTLQRLAGGKAQEFSQKSQDTAEAA